LAIPVNGSGVVWTGLGWTAPPDQFLVGQFVLLRHLRRQTAVDCPTGVLAADTIDDPFSVRAIYVFLSKPATDLICCPLSSLDPLGLGSFMAF